MTELAFGALHCMLPYRDAHLYMTDTACYHRAPAAVLFKLTVREIKVLKKWEGRRREGMGEGRKKRKPHQNPPPQKMYGINTVEGLWKGSAVSVILWRCETPLYT